MRERAEEETESLNEQKEQAEAEIRNLLIPKDPQDERNAILEIRGGTGGDEASLLPETSCGCTSVIARTKAGKPLS